MDHVPVGTEAGHRPYGRPPCNQGRCGCAVLRHERDPLREHGHHADAHADANSDANANADTDTDANANTDTDADAGPRYRAVLRSADIDPGHCTSRVV